MGRKKSILNWKKVERAAISGAKGKQIAAMLGIHYNTLVYCCKEDNNCDLCEYLAQKKEEGNQEIHKKLYEVAMNGNTTMLIWLGKQRLGQRDVYKGENNTVVNIWYTLGKST